jgi:hypothetical protein
LTRTRRIPQVGRNEVRLPARRSNFGDRLFTPFDIPAYDKDMDAQLGQLVGHSATNAARYLP